MILIDTDMCIEILRGNKDVIKEREKSDETIAISFMTITELYYGAEKSQNSPKNIGIVDAFLLTVIIINTDLEILKKFGELKHILYKNNFLLPDADILIAATTFTKCSKLVTGNTKHFKHFENLEFDNWRK